VQSVPFNTKFEGQAPIKAFFQVEKDGEVLTSHFRGRELKGKAVIVPSEFQGLVISRDSNRYVSADVFKEIVLWEHDVATDATEQKLRDLIDFAELANCLHSG